MTHLTDGHDRGHHHEGTPRFLLRARFRPRRQDRLAGARGGPALASGASVRQRRPMERGCYDHRHAQCQ